MRDRAVVSLLLAMLFALGLCGCDSSGGGGPSRWDGGSPGGTARACLVNAAPCTSGADCCSSICQSGACACRGFARPRACRTTTAASILLPRRALLVRAVPMDIIAAPTAIAAAVSRGERLRPAAVLEERRLRGRHLLRQTRCIEPLGTNRRCSRRARQDAARVLSRAAPMSGPPCCSGFICQTGSASPSAARPVSRARTTTNVAAHSYARRRLQEPLLAYGTCKTDAECCGGSCRSGQCACQDATQPCSSNADCCWKPTCRAGQCGCVPQAGDCAADSDCCGFLCHEGIGKQIGCLDYGATCIGLGTQRCGGCGETATAALSKGTGALAADLLPGSLCEWERASRATTTAGLFLGRRVLRGSLRGGKRVATKGASPRRRTGRRSRLLRWARVRLRQLRLLPGRRRGVLTRQGLLRGAGLGLSRGTLLRGRGPVYGLQVGPGLLPRSEVHAVWF